MFSFVIKHFRLSKEALGNDKLLVCYGLELIMSVKNFNVQALGINAIKHFSLWLNTADSAKKFLAV